ncbi:uncharacterized protein LOC142979596 [Anticarsia gemmatalis]|uniref:uncharacterized protein LOC142979596 n=1 Tax=Anticarsia gemmatalis TaxID=129554 RepID=UPI003F761B22
MLSLKYIAIIFQLVYINLNNCVPFEEDIVIEKSGKKFTTATDFQASDYIESYDKWLERALLDIAYYLRHHKFNEWDRRYYKRKPEPDLVGFYVAFPSPSLKNIHWEVQRHCQEDFLKCVTYLHSVVETAPFTRTDDLITSLNKHFITINVSSLQDQNEECKKALLYTEKTGLPFGGTREKFLWRTSASYYMCWYAMKGTPALSMLGESCDNFANCLDPIFGNRNHDPRSDDKSSFACAVYSFCPDPCCPLKHVHTLSQCHNSMLNPCYVENVKNSDISTLPCHFNRRDNQNLEHIIANKWNVSCHCQRSGFTWSSRYGMCVDINECMTKQHDCDLNTEDCLNLPGTYQCICKWGYVFDPSNNQCVEQRILMVPVEAKTDRFEFIRRFDMSDFKEIFDSL